MKEIAFLITLFFCHWLGDFTHLSLPDMLSAKRTGKPLMPIFMHASFHAIFCFLTVFAFANAFAACIAYFIMLSTHFLIDVLKGRMNVWFPSVTDTTKYRHWYLFGLDQYLHTVVIVIIWYLSTSNP